MSGTVIIDECDEVSAAPCTDELEDWTSPESACDDAPPQQTTADDRDEPWWFTKNCKSAANADAKLRTKLADAKKARAVYRDDLALRQTTLSPAQFRTLSLLLGYANPDLTNAFPSQEGAAKKLGVKRTTYNQHVAALRAKGWIRTHEFHVDGKQGNSGIQFLIPAGVLPLGEPWEGPCSFPNHAGEPKRPRSARRRGGRPPRNLCRGDGNTVVKTDGAVVYALNNSGAEDLNNSNAET